MGGRIVDLERGLPGQERVPCGKRVRVEDPDLLAARFQVCPQAQLRPQAVPVRVDVGGHHKPAVAVEGLAHGLPIQCGGVVYPFMHKGRECIEAPRRGQRPAPDLSLARGAESRHHGALTFSLERAIGTREERTSMTQFKEVKIPAGRPDSGQGRQAPGRRPPHRGQAPRRRHRARHLPRHGIGGRRGGEEGLRRQAQIVWCPVYCGLEGLHHYGEVLAKESVEVIQHLKLAIKGPFTTPIGEETHVCLHCAHQQYHAGACDECRQGRRRRPRFRSINVGFRQAMDLYACVRPVRYFEGVPAPNKYAEKVNFVIFRENTEDVYAGHDFERGGEVRRGHHRADQGEDRPHRSAPTAASASSRSRSPAPSAWSARPCSGRSTTSSPR